MTEDEKVLAKALETNPQEIIRMANRMRKNAQVMEYTRRNRERREQQEFERSQLGGRMFPDSWYP